MKQYTAHSRFDSMQAALEKSILSRRIIAALLAAMSIGTYMLYPFEGKEHLENTVVTAAEGDSSSEENKFPGSKKTAPTEVVPYTTTTTSTTTTTTTTTTTLVLTTAPQIEQKKEKTVPETVPEYVQPTTAVVILTTSPEVIQKDKKTAPETVLTYEQPTSTTTTTTTTTLVLTTAPQIEQKKEKTVPETVPTYTKATTTVTSIVQKDKKNTPKSVPVYSEVTTTVTSLVQKNKKNTPESVPVYSEVTTTVTSLVQKSKKSAPETVPVYTEATTTVTSIVQKSKKDNPKTIPEYTPNYDQGRTPDYDQGYNPEYDQGSVVEQATVVSVPGSYSLRIYLTEETDWAQLVASPADAKRLADFNGQDVNAKAQPGEYNVPEGLKLKIESNLYFDGTLYSVISDEAIQNTLLAFNNCDASNYTSPLKVPSNTAIFFNKKASSVSYNDSKNVYSEEVRKVELQNVEELPQAQPQETEAPEVIGPKEFNWEDFTKDFDSSKVGFAVGTDRDYIYGFNAATLFPTDCIGKPAFIARFLWNLENRVDVNTGEKHSLNEIVELNSVAAQHLKNSTVMNSERGFHVGQTCELKQACFYSISYSDNTGYEIAAYYNKLWFGEDDKEFLTSYFNRTYSGKGRYGSQTAQRMLQEAQYVVNYLKSNSPYAQMLKDWMSSNWSYYQAYVSYYAENFSDYEYVGRKIGWWDGQQTELIILCDADGNWTIVIAMTLCDGDTILPKIGEAIVEYRKWQIANPYEDDEPDPDKTSKHESDPTDFDYGDYEETPTETPAAEITSA